MALAGGLGAPGGDRVQDSEKLYRGVRPNLWKQKRDGSFYLSSQAFTDPEYRISVYRACLCGYRPSRAQKDPSYYVCSLLAEQVRAIDSVRKMRNEEVEQVYRIDVVPEPLEEDEDDSHAVICAIDEISSPKVFQRLQEALAHPDRYDWESGFSPPGV